MKHASECGETRCQLIIPALSIPVHVFALFVEYLVNISAWSILVHVFCFVFYGKSNKAITSTVAIQEEQM